MSDAAPPLEVFVVSHTHWDREWYRTAGEFRQRLVELIDDLLNDPGPSPFLLDGQTVVLEDYLDVRPERAAELSAALRDERLEAGPWFVLADGLIPSGEALVRNALAGRRTLRRLRAEAPPAFYCPDAFGHPAVLPAIAAGFGAPIVVTWRGYGGARWPDGDVARWRAPDGAQALLLHLPPDGYEFASSLPAGDPAAQERWRRIEAVLARRTTLGASLLTNGADHHARQLQIGAALEALGRAAAPHRVRVTTLATAAHAFVERAASRALPTVSGELRDSYGYTWTLQGTFASRAYQKRANAQVERLLLRDVEPWLALLRRHGHPSQGHLVDAAWRTLLLCHPHDSLCGCSTDDVASAVDLRLADARLQGLQLRDRAARVLLGHREDDAVEQPTAWRPVVLLRNRAPRRRRGVAEVELDVHLADVPVGPRSAGVTPPPARFTPRAALRGLPPVQVLERRRVFAREEAPRHHPRNALVERRRVLAWVDDMPPLGARAVPLATRPRRFEPGMPLALALGAGVANDALSVIVDEGSVNLRVGDRGIRNLVSLESAADRGDLYTPSIIPGSERTGSLARWRVSARGPLRAELTTWWRVPIAPREVTTAADEVRSHAASQVVVRLCLAVDAGAGFVRLFVTGENRSTDYRLRLRVHSGLAGADTWADAAFGLVERRAHVIAEEDQSHERVTPTAPLHRYVSRYTSDVGFTLIGDGLAEYEASDDGSVAVTLVRAVGDLSRPNLPERPGHAGWPVATADAQGQGPFEAAFAVALHGPKTPEVVHVVEQMADDVLLPIAGTTWRSAIEPTERVDGPTLEGEGLAMTAVKESEDRQWTVLRCVNLSPDPVPGRWILPGITEAALGRLDETPLGVLEVRDASVSFTAPPRGIVTVMVR